MPTPSEKLAALMCRTTDRRAPRERHKVRPGIPAGTIEVKPMNSKNGFNPLALQWVISPARKDRRVGPIQDHPLSDYAKELYKTITLGLWPENKPTRVFKIPEPEKLKTKVYILFFNYKAGREYAQQAYEFSAEHDGPAWVKATDYLAGLEGLVEDIELFEGERGVPLEVEAVAL